MRAPVYFFFLSILILPAVTGFGIAQEYLENKTLPILPGENSTHNIELQNPSDEFLAVNITISGKYSSFENGTQSQQVVLRPEKLRTYIPVYISVPENATPQTTHKIAFSARPVVSEEGMINMELRINDHFFVSVQQPPSFGERVAGGIEQGIQGITQSNTTKTLLTVTAAILILLLIYKKSQTLAGRMVNSHHRLALKINSMTEEEFQQKKRKNTLHTWAKNHSNPKIAVRVAHTNTKEEAIQELLKDE